MDLNSSVFETQPLAISPQTSKSVLAQTGPDELLELYDRYTVDQIADLKGPSLNSAERKRLKAAIWGRLERDPRYKPRPSGDAIRRAALGRPRRNLLVRGHSGEGPVNKWKIVELTVSGKSSKEIQQLLNRKHPAIYWPLRRMGFPTDVFPCYSFGEIFDGSALRRLHLTCGLNLTEMSRQLRIKFATLEPHLAPRRKRRALRFDTALKATSWRKSLFAFLMSNGSCHAGDDPTKYAQSRVILTFFPNIRERYAFLHKVLDEISQALRPNPEWKLENLQQYLCDQAILESVGRRSGKILSQFLPWAPDLLPFLAGRLDAVRGVRHQQLAFEAIASSLSTTPAIISSLVNRAQAANIKPIPPEEMKWLTLNWQAHINLQSQKTKGTPGRKPGRSKEKQSQIDLAAAFTKLNWSQSKMSGYIFGRENTNSYINTRNLFSVHRTEIHQVADRITLDVARDVCRKAGAAIP